MKVNIDAIKAKTSEALDKTKKFAGDAKNKVVETGSKIVKEAPKAYEVSKEKVVKGISEFKLTAKRMDIQVIKDNVKVINDSYNASYDSMKAALEVMGKAESSRKIAVLGNMLELGDYTKELHQKVGDEVIKNKIDILVTVGEYAKEIGNRAKSLGMQNVFEFENISDSIKYLEDNIQTGDLILLKASNSMNFSKILNELKN